MRNRRVRVRADWTIAPVYYHLPVKYRVVIAGDGYVRQFKDMLATLTKDVEEAYHGFVYRMVECLRYRDKVETEIQHALQSLELNLKQIDYANTAAFVQLVSDMSGYLFDSFKSNRMYSGDGVLNYTYLKHPDKNFEDFLFGDVLRLPYKRERKNYERRR
jgi:hypothetical protein